VLAGEGRAGGGQAGGRALEDDPAAVVAGATPVTGVAVVPSGLPAADDDNDDDG